MVLKKYTFFFRTESEKLILPEGCRGDTSKHHTVADNIFDNSPTKVFLRQTDFGFGLSTLKSPQKWGFSKFLTTLWGTPNF